MAGDVNLPKMDLNKYEQYISKSLSAGTENKTGAAKAQQVLSNMSHNLQAFVKQVHTYFNEQTKTGDRKWVNNERVVKSLNKKFDKLEKNQSRDSKVAFADVQQSINEARDLLKSMRQAGIPGDEITELNRKLDVLDKATSKEKLPEIREDKRIEGVIKKREKAEAPEIENARKLNTQKMLVGQAKRRQEDALAKEALRVEKEREKGLQIVPFEDNRVIDKTSQEDRFEGLKDRGVSDKGLEMVSYEGSRVIDKTAQKDRSEGLKDRGIKEKAEAKSEESKARTIEQPKKTDKAAQLSTLKAQLSVGLRELINAVKTDEDFKENFEPVDQFPMITPESQELKALNSFKTFKGEKDIKKVITSANTLLDAIQEGVDASKKLQTPHIMELYQNARNWLGDIERLAR